LGNRAEARPLFDENNVWSFQGKGREKKGRKAVGIWQKGNEEAKKQGS
jgi:hypothetical protein